jgi:hypothetical protein
LKLKIINLAAARDTSTKIAFHSFQNSNRYIFKFFMFCILITADEIFGILKKSNGNPIYLRTIRSNFPKILVPSIPQFQEYFTDLRYRLLLSTNKKPIMLDKVKRNHTEGSSLSLPSVFFTMSLFLNYYSVLFRFQLLSYNPEPVCCFFYFSSSL